MNPTTKQLKLSLKAECYLSLLRKAQARQTRIYNDLQEFRGLPVENIKENGDYNSSIKLTFNHENDLVIKIARMNDIQRWLLKRYHFLILDMYHLTNDFILPINFTI